MFCEQTFRIGISSINPPRNYLVAKRPAPAAIHSFAKDIALPHMSVRSPSVSYGTFVKRRASTFQIIPQSSGINQVEVVSLECCSFRASKTMPLICWEGNVSRVQTLLQPIAWRIFNAEYVLGQISRLWKNINAIQSIEDKELTCNFYHQNLA